MLTWTVNELAEIFDRSQATITKWIRDEKLHGAKPNGMSKGYFISDRSLMEFLKNHPDRYRQFMTKLKSKCMIGNKSSQEVLRYLTLKGYLT